MPDIIRRIVEDLWSSPGWLYQLLPSTDWLYDVWTGICGNSAWDFLKSMLRGLAIAPAITISSYVFRRRKPALVTPEFSKRITQASWQTTCHAAEIRQLIDQSIELFRGRTGCECIFEAYIFDPSIGKLVGIDLRGNGHATLGNRTFSVSRNDQPSDTGLSGQCFMDNRELLIPDRRYCDNYRTFADQFAKTYGKLLSYALVPVRLKNDSTKAIGVIGFASQYSSAFTQSDLEIIVSIADGFTGCFELEMTRRANGQAVLTP